MSHYSKIFNKVPVQIPNKSGFDLSHENLFTGKCGTLYPVLVDQLLPNDTISLGHLSQIQLPPMATDFYGRVMGKFEAFFVPNRILFGGWQDFITHPVNGAQYPLGTTSSRRVLKIPSIVFSSSDTFKYLSPGSLADFLGVKFSGNVAVSRFSVNNALPFIAYHKIYDDWYRDSRIQSPVFAPLNPSTPSPTGLAGTLPYVSSLSATSSDISMQSLSSLTLADGFNILSLRQRNWEKDYFTNATPQPQAGDPAQLAFKVDTSTGNGSFTIASLRAANSLQQWMERNNIAGYRYGDQIKAQFGIYPADAITDRAIYLGSHTIDVYNRSVYQSNDTSDIADASSRNPFTSVAAKYGSPQSVGDGSLVDKFTASEHGFIVVMFSLVPRAYYSSGSRRYLRYGSSADFPFPLLSGVGDQPIYVQELSDDVVSVDNQVFGYTQRYSECKYMDDEVHGLLRDGQSLSAFALQRSFDSSVELGSDFLEIPQNYLDQVLAVSGDFNFWADSYFAYKKSSTLPAYSIPTLGDPKDTHTEVIDNGGKRL